MNIRAETPADYPAVEQLTREAFWNVHVPGCDEHYLVHIMRSASEFLPALALVAELEGQIVGNIILSAMMVPATKPLRSARSLCFLPTSGRVSARLSWLNLSAWPKRWTMLPL